MMAAEHNTIRDNTRAHLLTDKLGGQVRTVSSQATYKFQACSLSAYLLEVCCRLYPSQKARHCLACSGMESRGSHWHDGLVPIGWACACR